MITRRETLRLFGSAPLAAWFAAAESGLNLAVAPNASATAYDDSTPPLAPGAPTSPERLALVDAFRKQSDGLEKEFVARTHKSDWAMPYRLFRPEASGKLPLVVYLHGSGGLGDDNLKQLALGNSFGTRVWLLPENQKSFPCYVLVPQTDRGWSGYDFSQDPPKPKPGLGDGTKLALEIVDALTHEFPVDDHRIYVTGQSMGGAGTWNMIASRPHFFAAAIPICGSVSLDDGSGSIDTPLWNFHGDSDATVPVSVSRARIAARRKAGGRPLSTEYSGVDHNSWQWAFTEPSLPAWLFSHRRP